MKVKLIKRCKGGWKEEEKEMTPQELKPIRRALRSTVARRIASKPGQIAFDVTPIGEYIYGSTSGNLTELTEAGICVACLGCGRNKNNDNRDNGVCPFCFGSGDYEPPADEWEQKLRNRLAMYVPFRRNQTREEFIGYCACQIACYGGDNTWELLGHYGERLDAEISKIIVS